MSVYLEKIEDAISNIQNNNNVSHHLNLIRNMLNLEFKCNCVELNLVENKTVGYFFGAHVFPTEKELYKISSNVIRIGENIKFEKCSEFIIELDSKLIYDMDTTPGEILAVLLHEIGHKVFQTDAQVRTKALFSLRVAKFLPTAGLVLKVFTPIKFMLYTLILVGFESSFATYNTIKTEVEADQFVIANGYAVELNSILMKISGENAMNLGLSVRSSSCSTQEKLIMNWTLQNALQFSIRRASIVKDLNEQLRGEESPAIRKTIESQLNQIKKTKGSFSIKAIKNEELEHELNESLRTFFEMHKKGYSHLELDELEVEIDRIESHEDKLYVINRIHSNLKKADAAMKKSNSKNPSEYKEFKSELNKLLKKAKDVKITIPDYTQNVINITYPKGYEG